MSQPSKRTPTAIDVIAEQYLADSVELQPEMRVWLGWEGDQSQYADHSPASVEPQRALVNRTLDQLARAEVVDDIDWVTRTDLTRELELHRDLLDANWRQRDLNNIASPVQEIRNTFDLMPTDTPEQWHDIARRLEAVPDAVRGYLETLNEGIADHNTPARRQVEIALNDFRDIGTDKDFFTALAAQGPAEQQGDLTRGAQRATQAYLDLRTFLSDTLLEAAQTTDAVGRDLYQLHSRAFLGDVVDLDETYEWGIEELQRMRLEQEAIADQIKPGATVAEAIAHLEADPATKIHGTQALREWMQQTADKAIAELGRTHFDIAEPIRTIQCMIAPTTTGEIYYTGPSDDFARPGRMWWSVPEGVTEFDTWRELTTVYHEGVPGHHLQIAQATYNKDQLNGWRRIAGTSGHAEGWALYAERLMESLGYLDAPADRLGMLDGQRMRAARVVLDLGVHLGKPRLDGTGTWDYDYALEFMGQNVNMDPAFVKFEVNRYFGWPGQAPSYKIGQRIFEQIRDQAAARPGFDLKQFHMQVLNIGGVGLSTLREAVERQG